MSASTICRQIRGIVPIWSTYAQFDENLPENVKLDEFRKLAKSGTQFPKGFEKIPDGKRDFGRH